MFCIQIEKSKSNALLNVLMLDNYRKFKILNLSIDLELQYFLHIQLYFVPINVSI